MKLKNLLSWSETYSTKLKNPLSQSYSTKLKKPISQSYSLKCTNLLSRSETYSTKLRKPISQSYSTKLQKPTSRSNSTKLKKTISRSYSTKCKNPLSWSETYSTKVKKPSSWSYSTKPTPRTGFLVQIITWTNDVYKNNQISKFNCSECEYSTPARQQIKYHIETNHEGIRYPCDVCNHQSRSVKNLRDHQASKHKINPRFRCKLCDFCTNHTRVKREHVLKRHPESMGQEIFEINKQAWKGTKQGYIQF